MLDQYYRINQAAGVNINLRQDGAVTIDCCSIIAKGNQLDISQKMLGIQTFEDFAKHLPAKAPIALNLSGKGVLHKRIEKTEIIGQGNFNQILPNASMDDFYVQNFISGGSSFISVIRRSEADKWIDRVKQHGCLPLSLSLGPFSANYVFSLLNEYCEEIRFDGNRVVLDEQKDWIHYDYDETARAPFPLKIGSEVIDEKLLIPYAAVFQLILAGRLDVIQASVPLLAKEFKNKLNEQKLKVNGFLTLAVFFVFLLINFLVFTGLESANARLAAQASQFTQNTTNNEDLSEKVKNKEALLSSLGWDGGINKSALIDQLASMMPDGISLKEIAVNPVDLSGSRIQRSVVFLNQRLNITGTSDQIIPVNEWIARIKTNSWVKNIQMESYAFNNELGTGQFTIRLDY